MAVDAIIKVDVWFTLQGDRENIYSHYFLEEIPPTNLDSALELIEWFETVWLPILAGLQTTTLTFNCIDAKQIVAGGTTPVLTTEIGRQKTIAISGSFTGDALPGQCSLLIQTLPNFGNSNPRHRGRDYWTGLVNLNQDDGDWDETFTQLFMTQLRDNLMTGIVTANGGEFRWVNFSHTEAKIGPVALANHNIGTLRALKHVRTQRRRQPINPCDKYILEA